MKVTITVRTEHNGIETEGYAIGDDLKPLRFKSVKDAIYFLANHNWKIEDLLGVDFNFEEEVCTG
jgi:hypothetical protein